ncbi:Gfo/Idh/MocA family protein [Brachybacterium kimchii]|uniref:Gfo/Idh/MocA family oxidoreductase n=1 Tax=Brachybacterium kimchii TaxID=2942909 RepID=A0ABY4N2L9_9MICO|nr:Gfo/Idh/MocA family oxidoreductase [Brachybacterium kimchii]UQN28783.1 Gfo/Idh/MocA family oxidoreductase [Brachybacterium kimchii]
MIEHARAPWVNTSTTTNSAPLPEPTRFALIGAGWRSRIFVDIARARPDLFTLTAVLARRPAAARERLGADVPMVEDLDSLGRSRPDMVVVCLPREVMPRWIEALVDRGLVVLCETPPAGDLSELRALWSRVGDANAVQVAEQYLRMPENAAALTVSHSGLIGAPTSVHVSSTHDYHAVSMIRGLLGAGRGPATVRSHRRTSPLADPLDPDGWTGDIEPRPRTTTLATIDFDDAGVGLYDFTENQWWNPLRQDHLTVRGTRGEIRDGSVVRMLDATTPVTAELRRRRTGEGMNLEGSDTATISLGDRVLYRNPFEGGRFNDDEIAVATIMAETGEWARDRPARDAAAEGPYPLADACHDHAIACAFADATDEPTRVAGEPWMSGRH